jgi:hypothetical protein
VPDGGGLTKVIPSTVGDTEVLGRVVCELADVALPKTLGVTVGVLVGVAPTVGLTVTVGETVGEGLAVHRLLLGLTVVNAWGLGLSGTGSGAGAVPGLAVTVTTMLSDTWGPCARASAPSDSVAAPALAALSTNVTIEAHRRD